MKKVKSKKNIRRIFLFCAISCVLIAFGYGIFYEFQVKGIPQLKNIRIGASKEEVLKYYPKEEERTYRISENEEWISFNYLETENSNDIITFHLKDGYLISAKLNDRKEITKEYLSEFCSQAIIKHFTNIYAAIQNIFSRLPDETFLDITDRTRPVMFTEYYDTGAARFANSSQIRFLEDDPPTFTNGLWIVKINTALENADSLDAIIGVIAHELAHRILEHGNSEDYSPEMETEANNLVKQLGFENELLKAREQFKE